MLGNLTGWHLLIVLAIIILLFGATRLPGLAKGIGQSMRIFKNEMAQPKATITSTESVDGSASSEDARPTTSTKA